MKTAVLSDIHSNYHALKACCDDALPIASITSFFWVTLFQILQNHKKLRISYIKYCLHIPASVCAAIENDICWSVKGVLAAFAMVQNLVRSYLLSII